MKGFEYLWHCQGSDNACQAPMTKALSFPMLSVTGGRAVRSTRGLPAASDRYFEGKGLYSYLEKKAKNSPKSELHAIKWTPMPVGRR